MLYHERFDVYEGIDVNKKGLQESVIFATIDVS